MNFKKGTIKRLHVDKRVIASNLKHGKDDPPITLQTSRGSFKTKGAKIHGPSTFIYDNENPLSCGARLWIETTAEVETDVQMKRVKRSGKCPI